MNKPAPSRSTNGQNALSVNQLPKFAKLFSVWPYVRAMRRMVYEMRFDQARFLTDQKQSFTDLGLSYERSLATLHTTLAADGLVYDENLAMCSQHWVFFAGLVEYRPMRLLEIGTYDGSFTRVLAKLFPKSEIVTCDLPDHAPSFTDSYDRAGPARESFLARRTRNLHGLSNVDFVQANSFLLPSLNVGRFDALWVDGGHSYPEVAWDSCNAFHMANEGAFILFDDVYLTPKAPTTSLVPDFNESGELLKLLEAERLLSVRYIAKRVLTAASADPVLRKYIAVARKPAINL